MYLKRKILAWTRTQGNYYKHAFEKTLFFVFFANFVCFLIFHMAFEGEGRNGMLIV